MTTNMIGTNQSDQKKAEKETKELRDFPLSKLRPLYNNLSGGCRLVQQVVKCSIYYNNLSRGCGLAQQVVKC
jgi:hypothetical protein